MKRRDMPLVPTLGSGVRGIPAMVVGKPGGAKLLKLHVVGSTPITRLRTLLVFSTWYPNDTGVLRLAHLAEIQRSMSALSLPRTAGLLTLVAQRRNNRPNP
jgi:hypothetical protein